MKTISAHQWKALWSRFDVILNYLSNRTETRDVLPGSQQRIIIRNLLDDQHGVRFTTAQWKQLNKDFNGWYESSFTYPDWTAQKRWMQ